MNSEEPVEVEVSNQEQIEIKEKRAREIANGGVFENIVEDLFDEKLLEGCIEKTKEDFGARIKNAHFEAKEKDWEILTAIRLFHLDTAEHCVRTLEILSHKIHETLTRPDGGSVNLDTNIIAENITIEEFLRAALLHDVGKIIVPRSILDNPLSNTNWWQVLSLAINSEGEDSDLIRNHIAKLSGAPFNIDTYRKDLDSHDVRPIQVCPVDVILPPEDISDLAKRGFTKENTILEIIMAHEEESRRILEASGFPVEAKLASMHHNYLHRDIGGQNSSVEALRVGADVVGISMADIIHLADVTDALVSSRSYKGPMPISKVLTILIQHANSGKVGKEMTYMWIKSELSKNKISEDEKMQFADDFKEINLFLSKQEKEAQVEFMAEAA
ncbi:MAG: Uncharacterized protein LiPW30_355 [Parcubacteria group bacterium LiPW_30]|nr:MAG: Uncharacterized protein LiPW30_355 [Parcubacteria group bacterium LiPW_30]